MSWHGGVQELRDCLQQIASEALDPRKRLSPDFMDDCQAAFAALLEMIASDKFEPGKFSTQDAFARYVWAAVRRRAMKRFRKSKNGQAAISGLSRLTSQHDLPAEPEYDRLELIREAVMPCIDELDGRSRRILVEVDWNEVSREDVCRIEDISNDNLRTILRRARAQVRECVARKGVTLEVLSVV